MEDASKKRGRPRLLSREYENTLGRLYPELATGRSLENQSYIITAFTELGNGKDPEFDWLFGGNDDPDHGHWKKTILEQLGRCFQKYSRESVLALARDICSRKPTTKAAERMIRELRTGKQSAAPEGALANSILKAVNDHIKRYPSTLRNEVVSAIESVALAFKAVSKEDGA